MTISANPWAAYEPSDAEPWDRRRVAHLHLRAGFGATWADLQRDLKAGPAASVDRLLDPPKPSADEEDVLASLGQGVLEARDAERLKAWWLYRILYGGAALREKLTLFWHSHFATSNRKVESVALMLRQNETLRRHALGDFADLLADICADPAMLLWLDGAGSNKDRPNENFAREFLELFTLGIGHYTEADVRAAARAFTGWARSPGTQYHEVPKFQRDPTRCDDGSKTFLKQTGNWQPADIVRLTLEQPAAAVLLCRKLYRFLVNESVEPAAALIAPLADELRSHRYSIRHVVSLILRSRHFHAQAARRQRLKGPVEFSVGLVHVLEVPRAEVSLLALAATCDQQGQELFYPPNVKGWDGGKSWINSATLPQRGNWANDLIWGNAELGVRPYDPLAWAKRHGQQPAQAVEGFLELLLQADLPERARALVLHAGRAGTKDGLRKAIQLLVSCPEYQLA